MAVFAVSSRSAISPNSPEPRDFHGELGERLFDRELCLQVMLAHLRASRDHGMQPHVPWIRPVAPLFARWMEKKR